MTEPHCPPRILDGYPAPVAPAATGLGRGSSAALSTERLARVRADARVWSGRRRPYAHLMSENLSDHVAENRRYWDAMADQWVSGGERAWEQEARWGEWQIPNTELPLADDMHGLPAIELGCGTGCVSAWMPRRGRVRHRQLRSPTGHGPAPQRAARTRRHRMGARQRRDGPPTGRLVLWTDQIDDARLLGLEGRTGHATFRLLHVLEFRDGKISRENVWADTAAIIAQTQPRLADR